MLLLNKYRHNYTDQAIKARSFTVLQGRRLANVSECALCEYLLCGHMAHRNPVQDYSDYSSFTREVPDQQN